MENKKIKQSVLIISLLLLVFINLSFLFEFDFRNNDILMITGLNKQKIFVNGVFKQDYVEQNIAKLLIKSFDGETAKIEGKYSFYKFDQHGNKSLNDFENVKFEQKTTGKMIVNRNYIYPVLRSSPVFPKSNLEIDDTWWRKGEEVQDFSDFGVNNTIARIPLNICYTYKEDIIKEGKKYSIVSAKYDFIYEFDREKYIQKNINGPQIYGGTVEIDYYWDTELNYSSYYEQKYSLYVIMIDGTKIKYEGIAEGEVNRVRKWTKKDKENLAKKITDELKDNNVDAKVEVTDDGIILSLGEIFFDYNSSELSEFEIEKLEFIGYIIEKYFLNYQISINGYTDDIGSYSYNRDLSLKRAYAVYNYLVSNGYMNSSSSGYYGYGETNPKYPNTSEENRRKNRRVEILITDY